MKKVSSKNSLREIISEKYDNEINDYKLIAFENVLLNSKMLDKYTNRVLDFHYKISFSIKKVMKKIEKNFRH